MQIIGRFINHIWDLGFGILLDIEPYNMIFVCVCLKMVPQNSHLPKWWITKLPLLEEPIFRQAPMFIDIFKKSKPNWFIWSIGSWFLNVFSVNFQGCSGPLGQWSPPGWESGVLGATLKSGDLVLVCFNWHVLRTFDHWSVLSFFVFRCHIHCTRCVSPAAWGSNEPVSPRLPLRPRYYSYY